MHRHVVGRMSPDHRDAGRGLAGLVIGRPIDRAALQEAEANTVPLDNRGSAGDCPVGAGPGMRDAEAVELRDRCHDRRFAVIDIVGEADPLETA